jgi:predicted branched-subunit amino acid permease
MRKVLQNGEAGFARGAYQSLPVMAAMIPFAMMFGATAVNYGYSIGETVFASATVFAGASQFVFMEVNGLAVPAWSVVLAVFAVNFRHILYSASLGRWMFRFNRSGKWLAFFFMTDIQWAASEAHLRGQGKHSIIPSWYFGYALPLYLVWVLSTFTGAYFGKLLDEPERFGLNFILPIYFLILLMGFRKRSNFTVIVPVSAMVSYFVLITFGEPWNITIGAIAGICLAAAMPPAKTPTHSAEELSDDAA